MKSSPGGILRLRRVVAAGCFSDTIPLRRSVILAERFLFHRMYLPCETGSIGGSADGNKAAKTGIQASLTQIFAALFLPS